MDVVRGPWVSSSAGAACTAADKSQAHVSLARTGLGCGPPCSTGWDGLSQDFAAQPNAKILLPCCAMLAGVLAHVFKNRAKTVLE